MAKPIKKFDLGQISLSVFENNGLLSLDIQRAYKDKQGETKYAKQFNPMHAPIVCALLQQALPWLMQEEQKRRKQRPKNGASQSQPQEQGLFRGSSHDWNGEVVDDAPF